MTFIVMQINSYMKNKLSLILSIIICFLFTISCKKDKAFMNNATIIGIDARMGVCTGGGYFIIVQGHANPNVENGAFTTDTMPSSFQISSNSHFPINVNLNWKVESKCGGNYMAISRIEKN